MQVDNLPYEPNIDVRDTVKYKEVMSQYGKLISSCLVFAVTTSDANTCAHGDRPARQGSGQTGRS